MQDLILSVDLGTTAVKVALFDKSGELMALSTQEYSLMTTEALCGRRGCEDLLGIL